MISKRFDPSASRRRFLQLLSGGMALTLPGWSLGAGGLWAPDEDLPITPAQGEGPFYPEIEIEKQLYNDTDLYQKMPGHEFAKGEPIVVHGSVHDRRGKPLPGAVVEIWQACAAGRYSHSQDKNQKALLDNNFQFWGRAVADQEGSYSFTTVLPGLYTGRMARHIHFRIDAPELKRLTTQCYFSEFGEDNVRDGLYQRLSPEERELVTVELGKPSENSKPRSGEFKIVVG